jgi:hypothetical protein
MLLMTFIVLQLILDVELVLFLLLRLRKRKAAPAPVPAKEEPPAWYRDFLLLAEDVLAAVEPALDALEERESKTPPAMASPGPVQAPSEARTPRERHREAFALLRAGAAPEDVARRERLQPGELRLIRNLIAAEAELVPAPRS